MTKEINKNKAIGAAGVDEKIKRHPLYRPVLNWSRQDNKQHKSSTPSKQTGLYQPN